MIAQRTDGGTVFVLSQRELTAVLSCLADWNLGDNYPKTRRPLFYELLDAYRSPPYIWSWYKWMRCISPPVPRRTS